MSECRNWYNGDPILEEYHDHEWCKINHNDDFQFQMLCLEGASVGLSWQIIMHKREAYLVAFHNFIIDECAAMTDDELEALRSDPGIIRNKSKIYSVRKNAQIVQKIQKEFGSFDAYLWSFTDGRQIDGHWKTPQEVPTVSEVSIAMSKDMKKRGIGFVGPVITYSFLQSIGIVNDHLEDCEYRDSRIGIDKSRLDEYSAQAKAAWGNTAEYKEFEEKAKGRTKEEDALLGEQCMQIFAGFGRIKDQTPDSEEAQKLVAQLQQFITDHFYNCTDKILSGLGRMYSGGGDFTKSIDEYAGEGTAEFADRAIQVYCSR